MKRTVLLFARIKTECVVALVPCPFTPRRSALSLIPVAQKIILWPLAKSSAQKIRSTADRKSTRLNSSHSQISYAVFCLKKKNTIQRLPPSQLRAYLQAFSYKVMADQ